MTGLLITSSTFKNVLPSSSNSSLIKFTSSFWEIDNRPIKFARDIRSSSVNIPTTFPSAFITGIALIFSKSIFSHACRTVCSGFNVFISRVITSLTNLSAGSGFRYRCVYLMTFTSSRVIIPSLTNGYIFSRINAIFSLVSTTSITKGRSSDMRKMAAV